jgi:hypothetical protein
LKWNSYDFEEEAAARNMVATALRTFDQWDNSPQGKALEGVPPVVLRRVADAPRRHTSHEDYSRPLDGVKVLDLTRVLAGPVCGRTLAGMFRHILCMVIEFTMAGSFQPMGLMFYG